MTYVISLAIPSVVCVFSNVVDVNRSTVQMPMLMRALRLHFINGWQWLLCAQKVVL